MRTLTIFALSLGAVSAHAGLVGVTGLGDILPAASALYTADAFNDASAIVHGWDEKQNHTLSANLRIDATGVGTWNLSNDAELSIASGTVIDSHAFYFDPLQAKSVGTNANNQVTFTFDQKILGVIYTGATSANTKLGQSDHLIAFGSAPAYFGSRGFEADDSITVIDAYTISYRLNASSPGDQIRVVTEAVPEPGTMAALALGAAGFLRKRRKA